MKIDKFPSRIQSIIEEFESKENQKRWRYLLKIGNKTLVASRIEFNENTNEAFVKYSASSSNGYKINPLFIEKLSDIQIEKTNIIRKKLGLRAPLKRRPIERDELGIPIKKPRREKKNKELSELEFKAMFDPRFISSETRDELFEEKNLSGGARLPKKAFKKIKPEFREAVKSFLSKYIDLHTITADYKRDNYGTLSLIVGKTFTNNGQIDPRFKTYKSFTLIHRQGKPYVKVIQNSVKTGTDTIFYLINEDTLLQVSKSLRYRNRG